MPIRARSLLRKSFLSYLLIFILLLALGLVGFVQSSQLLEKETKEYNLAILLQKQQEIDARLKEINKLINDFSLNARITSFVYSTPDMGKDYYYRMHQALREITSLSLTNAFIHDTYIYHRRGQEVLTSSGVYDLENCFALITNYADLDYGTWYEMIENAPLFHTIYPARTIRLSADTQKSILTSISPLPNFAFSQQNSATLVVMLDGNKFINILENNLATEQSAIYIVDSAGQVILACGETSFADGSLLIPSQAGYFTASVNDTSVIVASAPSRVNGWRYVSVSPENLLMNKVDRTRTVSIFFIGGFVVLGLLLVLVLALVNYRPIENTVRTLQAELPAAQAVQPYNNEMDYIQRIVQKTVKENESMRKNFKEYMPVLKADTLTQLLRGEFSHGGDAASLLNRVGINFENPRFLVVSIAIEENVSDEFGHNRNLIKFVIKNVTEEILGGIGQCYALSLGSQTMCAIVNLSPPQTGDMEQLRPLLTCLRDTLCEQCSLSLSLGVSTVQEGLSNLHTAFNQAQHAQEYCQYHAGYGFCFFSEISSAASYYPYSVEMEQQLLSSVKMGGKETVDRLLHEIYSAPASEGTSSLEISRCMFFDLMGTALKLLSSLDIDYKQVFGDEDPFGLLYACKTISSMQSTVRMLFIGLCDHFKSCRTSHAGQLRDNLIAYIEKQYADPNLSLTMVADAFGITASYLSHFLKQNANENFVNLLRARRIQQAELLLKQTNMTLEEIARAIGYTSGIVLMRNFKKIHGIAPGQYRDKYGGK